MSSNNRYTFKSFTFPPIFYILLQYTPVLKISKKDYERLNNFNFSQFLSFGDDSKVVLQNVVIQTLQSTRGGNDTDDKTVAGDVVSDEKLITGDVGIDDKLITGDVDIGDKKWSRLTN